jgi:hypothetical protein
MALKVWSRWVSKHKWIDQEIARLDPNVEYERIWRLANAYRLNEFIMNFFYAFISAHFFATDRGGRTVVRDGKGKILKRQDKRFADTMSPILTWWENGPSAPETQRSVGTLNKLHLHYAKQYPYDMSQNDDYVYGLCAEAAAFHRFREIVGLPGYSPALQVAAYRFWTDMLPLFTTGSGATLTGWPADFDGLLAYMAEFEGRRWPYTEDAVIACEAVRRQFAERYFPKPLHGFAHAMVMSMYPDHILKLLKLKPPNRFLVRAVRGWFKWGMLLSEQVLPDPEQTISERLTAKGRPSAGVLGAAACPHAHVASSPLANVPSL